MRRDEVIAAVAHLGVDHRDHSVGSHAVVDGWAGVVAGVLLDVLADDAHQQVTALGQFGRHSAAFTWDGRGVVFGDEAGGGTAPRCRASDPSTLGAAWFYDVASLDNLDATTSETPRGHFKIPRIQGDANCTMHNFNFIPVRDRYVLVSSNYAGGTSVADFTNPTRPIEIAHLDPHGANTWSTYWYNGFVYANDSGRGLDMMLLSDEVRAGAKRFAYMRPQTQERLIL